MFYFTEKEEPHPQLVDLSAFGFELITKALRIKLSSNSTCIYTGKQETSEAA